MATLTSFPIDAFNSNKINSKVSIFVKEAKNSHGKMAFLSKPLILRGRRSSTMKQRGIINGKCSEPEANEEDNNPALQAVLKLYSEIKNQNIQEVSNIIGDECTCISNFFSFLQFFQGKQQVLKFLKYVMEILGKNIEFVVQPTLQDGMNVGVSWKLEWCKTHVPLGKGFSFHICQKYQGKVLIRNVEMFMEPILHIQPFRMKLMAYLMCLREMWSGNLPREKPKKAILALLLLAIILVFLKPGFY